MTSAQAETLLTRHQCGACRRDPLFAPCELCSAATVDRLPPPASTCVLCPCLACGRNRSVPRDLAALRQGRRELLTA